MQIKDIFFCQHIFFLINPKKNDSKQAEYTHYLRVKRSYMLFFILPLLMVLTGFGMALGGDLGLAREFRKGLKNFHGIVQYLMYACIFIHLAGVILAENGKIKGIVSGMIHGNKS